MSHTFTSGEIVTAAKLNAATDKTSILARIDALESLVGLWLPVGTIYMWHAWSLPLGPWIWLNGATIGSASSGATALADGGAEALYTVLWPNTRLDVSGGRGASATDDFAANKTLAVPDFRERVPGGFGLMGGGTSPGRLTNTGAGNPGINGAALGEVGGADRHTITTEQMPAHTHTINNGNDVFTFGGGGLVLGGGNSSRRALTNSNTGGDEAHPNAQPTIMTGFIIRY
jgi:hypothetical protein